MRLPILAATAALALLGNPALAQAQEHDGHHSGHHPDAPMAAAQPGGPRFAGFDPAARAAWLADCRHRLAARDSGIGGAVIGGVVGGIAGNRIAGRHDRTVGTIAGAAIGAVAGAAIDKAEDAGRNRDECEAYLDDYYASYTQGAQSWGYAHPHLAYATYGQSAPGCCMGQPVMAPVMMSQGAPHCTETVEYVYEDVPVRPAPRKRVIHRPSKVVPDKRVRVK